MRSLILSVLVLCVMGAAAGVATADDQLMAPIKKFIDSFNKGDMAGAAATHAAGADLTIIDEVAPHLWRGPQAFQAWSADLAADGERRGLTDPIVTISNPTREEVNGNHAYVVVPAVYTFKERGVAMQEKAQFVVVLQKGAEGWLIHGWAWVGPKPEPVAPSK